MYKIFLIEDDHKIRGELAELLGRYGYECAYSDDFENIAQRALESESHLVLLDINLPYFDGFHVCREIRKGSGVPVVIVTSRDSEADELMSMNLGADDFVTKPYNTQILLARIEAVLKRSYQAGDAGMLTYNGLTLDIARGTISKAGTVVELTKNELQILHLLMRRPGVIVSRDDIITELWQSEEFIDDNTLTVNIARLRGKLEEMGVEGYIKTRRGQGYMV